VKYQTQALEVARTGASFKIVSEKPFCFLETIIPQSVHLVKFVSWKLYFFVDVCYSIGEPKKTKDLEEENCA
jgi:hypothetical protein